MSLAALFPCVKDATGFITRNPFSPLDLRKALLYLEPDQFPIFMKPGYLSAKQFERTGDHFFRIFDVPQFNFALDSLFAGFINRDISYQESTTGLRSTELDRVGLLIPRLYFEPDRRAFKAKGFANLVLEKALKREV